MKQITIYLFLFLSLAFPPVKSTEQAFLSIDNLTEHQNALKVLQAKCNGCHKNENPSKYFTSENMNGFAKQIKWQVFIWKRMPKGRDNNLSKEEKLILKTWINKQLK